MTPFRFALVGCLIALAALGVLVLVLALARSAARQDAIAAQQRRHPHPSTLDQAIAVANSGGHGTGNVIRCADCGVHRAGAPEQVIARTGIADEIEIREWTCRAGHANTFRTVQPLTPRRGK